jgi:hypothetical protein
MGDEGAFHRWLVETQIEPVFRTHAFVQRAHVLVIPQLWMLPEHRRTTQMMIFYSAREEIDLDATVDALAQGAQDPNLPAGVSNHDLYLPIGGRAHGDGGAPPFALCSRELFAGLTRDPEIGHHEVLDAFASYGSFSRGEGGEVVCRRFDARLSAMIDHVM